LDTLTKTTQKMSYDAFEDEFYCDIKFLDFYYDTISQKRLSHNPFQTRTARMLYTKAHPELLKSITFTYMYTKIAIDRNTLEEMSAIFKSEVTFKVIDDERYKHFYLKCESNKGFFSDLAKDITHPLSISGEGEINGVSRIFSKKETRVTNIEAQKLSKEGVQMFEKKNGELKLSL
jgi:hypothetical protein